MSEHAVVMCTAPSREVAAELARAIVADRLAACVQLMPIDSWYVWDGEVQEEPEVLLLIKTRADRFGALEAHVVARHPYDVPELVQLSVTAGSSA